MEPKAEPNLWTGTPRSQVMLYGEQVAEVLVQGPTKVIRDIRPNGSVGVCFESAHWKEIHNWLDHHYPGCVHNT